MAQLGIGHTWWPSDIMISLLEFIHVSSQTPWWVSIALLTIVLRITLFPLALKTARNTAIIPYFRDKQTVLMEEVKKARESGELIKMRTASTKLIDLYREWGYSPFFGFAGIIQLPIFFAMFRTCWRCSHFPIPGWDTGGMLWFQDLTVSDPYLILPAISGVTTALTVLV